MKKKVLHVSAGGLNPGGVGSVIFSIVESLSSDFDFDCVVFNRISDREESFRKYGRIYRIYCYPRKGKRDYLELITRPFKLYFGIRQICKNEKYNAVHCHNQRDAWICLLAAKHMGVPIRIAHAHVTNSPKRYLLIERIYRDISTKMLFRTASVFAGCSDLACKQLYLHDQYVVVPNSVNLSVFHSNLHYSNENTIFIHVGRYTYAKNQEYVLDVFAEICKVIPSAYLYLVGYGEQADVRRLKDRIAHLGIANNVELVPGETVDVVEYYVRSKYMIFPSRFEGFGIVLIEAQAMGIQCYVSENIQPEADVGLLTFLQLSDGPKKWAEYILNDIQHGCEKTLNYEKLAQYSNENIAKRYAAIYNGEVFR